MATVPLRRLLNCIEHARSLVSEALDSDDDEPSLDLERVSAPLRSALRHLGEGASVADSDNESRKHEAAGGPRSLDSRIAGADSALSANGPYLDIREIFCQPVSTED